MLFLLFTDFNRKIMLLSIFGLFFSCSSSEAQVKNPAYRAMLSGLYKNTVPLISVQEASVATNQNFVFLDTREMEEYNVSHIKDATWVGYDDFSPSRLAGISPDSPIVVYCSVGYRSERIGEQLLTLGFKDVYNLNGGIFEWVNQKNPVVENNNQPTDKIHAYSKTWGIWISNGQKVY